MAVEDATGRQVARILDAQAASADYELYCSCAGRYGSYTLAAFVQCKGTPGAAYMKEMHAAAVLLQVWWFKRYGPRRLQRRQVSRRVTLQNHTS